MANNGRVLTSPEIWLDDSSWLPVGSLLLLQGCVAISLTENMELKTNVQIVKFNWAGSQPVTHSPVTKDRQRLERFVGSRKRKTKEQAKHDASANTPASFMLPWKFTKWCARRAKDSIELFRAWEFPGRPVVIHHQIWGWQGIGLQPFTWHIATIYGTFAHYLQRMSFTIDGCIV